MAANLDTLQVGTPHPEYHHMVPPSDEPRNVFGTVTQTDPEAVAAFMASVGQATAKLVSAQIFGQFKDTTTTGRERPAQSVDVTDDAEWALRERIRQRRLQKSTRRESVFQRLGGRAGSPTGEGQFQVRPEMTPRKVERGRQPGRASETSDRTGSRSQLGQKRRSASRARDEVDSKKGKTDTGSVGATGGKDRRVTVGIDWQTTGIEDPTPSPTIRLSSQTDPGLLSPRRNLKSSLLSSPKALPQDPLKLLRHLDTVAKYQHDLQRRRMRSLRNLLGSSRKTGSFLKRSLYGTKPTTGLLLRRINWIPRVTLKKPDPFDSSGTSKSCTG